MVYYARNMLAGYIRITLGPLVVGSTPTQSRREVGISTFLKLKTLEDGDSLHTGLPNKIK